MFNIVITSLGFSIIYSIIHSYYLLYLGWNMRVPMIFPGHVSSSHWYAGQNIPEYTLNAILHGLGRFM
jgi:hypothetical protein